VKIGALALLLVGSSVAMAEADPAPPRPQQQAPQPPQQAPQQPAPQPPAPRRPPPRNPQQIAGATGIIGRWMFADGACTTSTNWTFRPNGTGEAQNIEFRYTQAGAAFHLVWTAENIAQDYTLVVDGDRMTSALKSEERVCHWKRGP
jgi:hypothetical protein